MRVNKNYWQTIRGICIAMVVLIHCLGEGRIIDWIIIRKTINFCVAVFIFMAGHFIDVDKIVSKDFDYKQFLLMRGGTPFNSISHMVNILYTC